MDTRSRRGLDTAADRTSSPGLGTTHILTRVHMQVDKLLIPTHMET
jgi:hypothetical protein